MRSSSRFSRQLKVRPDPGRRLPGFGIADIVLPRLQPRSARLLAGTSATGTLDDLARVRHHLLVTFRRDGTAVPVTVWGARMGNRLYVRTERASGKAARLRRDPRALVAPATALGRPLGPPVTVSGRVLEAGEEDQAEAALAATHGWYRALFENGADRLHVDMCYLELTSAEVTLESHRGR